MIRSLIFIFLVLSFSACEKQEPLDIVLDNTVPVIDIQTPSASLLYDKDFPIHITGSVTDNYLHGVDIHVLDSLTHDTLYTYSHSVLGKSGFAFNEQYYNPADSGYKIIRVFATDSANHLSTKSRVYRVY